jgi:hypothetical protein
LDSTKGQDAIGGGINKDTVTSIQGNRHLIAAGLAQRNSYQILLELWGLIGVEKLGNFLGLGGNSLAIAIDTTGADVIESAW